MPRMRLAVNKGREAISAGVSGRHVRLSERGGVVVWNRLQAAEEANPSDVKSGDQAFFAAAVLRFQKVEKLSNLFVERPQPEAVYWS